MNKKYTTSFCFVVAGLLLGLVSLAYPTHGNWMDHFKDAAGMSCCGETDCKSAAIRVLTFGREMVTAEVDGVIVEVPALSVHQSQETRAFWCAKIVGYPPSTKNVRCLFWAVAS